MPINSRHPEYLEMEDEWIRNRDAFAGSKAIKSRAVSIGITGRATRVANATGNFVGSAYLPPLSEQSPSEYAAYRDRGLYHNVTGRAVSGFVGVMTRLPAKKKLPKALELYFMDATSDGISFDELYKMAVGEIILTNRVGLLVDRFPDGRPYVIPYTAEQVINWSHDGQHYDWVVIEKTILVPDPEDKFEQIQIQEWVELTKEFAVMEEGEEAVLIYIQKTWRAKDEKSEPVIVNVVIPTNRGEPFDEIPFFMVNDMGMSSELRKPVVSDIAEINISHYKTSCDLEHGRHFTALPTPVITGAGTQTKIKIGSTTAIILPDKQAKAFYLEFNGLGLASLENAIKEKESQMATMSARLIDQNRKGSEASGTVRMRFAGESNMLNGIAIALEGTFNRVYKIIAAMETENPDLVEITVNKDFIDDAVEANKITAWMELFLNETITLEMFLFNLRKGELVDPKLTDEEVLVDMKQLNPAFKSLEIKAKAASSNQGNTDITPTQQSDSGDTE